MNAPITLVRIKPAYLAPGEMDILYRVVEDNGDRLHITPHVSRLPIPGIEVVSTYMTEVAFIGGAE